MDSFKEQIVRKMPTQKDALNKIFIMIASIALAFAVIMLMFAVASAFLIFGVIISGAIIYGGYQLILRTDIEYEYIFTNGEIDFDKIIAQRSRKRLCTVKVATVTAIGKADGNFSVSEGRTLVMANAGDPELDDYYIDCVHKNLGETTVVFTPDEDMLRAIKSFLPRNLRNSVSVAESFESED